MAQTGVRGLTSNHFVTRQSLIPAVFVITLVVRALPAAAQSTDAQNATVVEVTPYASVGSYPSSRVGAAVAFRLSPTLSLESEAGYRHDTTGALSATMSVLYDLPRIGRVRPYAAAGAGLEEYGTAVQMPGGGISARQRLALALMPRLRHTEAQRQEERSHGLTRA